MNIKKKTHCYHDKHHQCACKACIGVAIIDWSQHPHMSSQQNNNMTTSHFDIFLHIFNHLQIAWLMCLWVDIHLGLVFVVILIADEWVNVGKKSSINQNWDLGNLGFNITLFMIFSVTHNIGKRSKTKCLEVSKCHTCKLSTWYYSSP